MDNLENFSTLFFSIFFIFRHFAHLQHPRFLQSKNPKGILSDFQVRQFIILYIQLVFTGLFAPQEYWCMLQAKFQFPGMDFVRLQSVRLQYRFPRDHHNR